MRMCIWTTLPLTNERKTNLNVHFRFLFGVCFWHRFLSQKPPESSKDCGFSPPPFSFLCQLYKSKLNVLRAPFRAHKWHNAVCSRSFTCSLSFSLCFYPETKTCSSVLILYTGKSFRPQHRRVQWRKKLLIWGEYERRKDKNQKHKRHFKCRTCQWNGTSFNGNNSTTN